MGIILTNGDSFTYGDELEGSRNRNGEDTHHHHTWTFKLSVLTGRKYVNLAKNGSSNMKIYRTTLDFLMSDDPRDIDLLVIVWSNFGRIEICEPEKSIFDEEALIDYESNMSQLITTHGSDRFKPKDEQEFLDYHEKRREGSAKRILLHNEFWREMMTMQTQILHTFMFMNHIQFICDKMGIPVMQGVIHGDMYKNFLYTMKNEGWKDYKRAASRYYHNLRPECKMGLGHYSDLYHLSKSKYTVKPYGHADEDAHTEYADILFNIIKEKDLIDVNN